MVAFRIFKIINGQVIHNCFSSNCSHHPIPSTNLVPLDTVLDKRKVIWQ